MEEKHVHDEKCHHDDLTVTPVAGNNDSSVIIKNRAVGMTTQSLAGLPKAGGINVPELILSIEEQRALNMERTNALKKKRKARRAKALAVARNKYERRAARRGATARQILNGRATQ